MVVTERIKERLGRSWKGDLLRWVSRRKTFTELQDLHDRVRTAEGEIERLKQGLKRVEKAVMEIDLGEELKQIETEVARSEAVIHMRRIEEEIRAAAARLEATTPHCPRA